MEGPPARVAAPLSADEFAACLAPFAPFEPAPHLAVAVSGGADSLALALLAATWAQACGGRITALTVDHRLRPAAAAEARQVAAWLGGRGIAHEVLTAAAPPPRRNLQAEARALRYRLLEGWCARAGVLHLLLAHHREDQAETVLLRLARGSGLDGLAGMAALVERAQCRVLRPLLGIAHQRLCATLAAHCQEWIEDPSNRDPAFARVTLRQAAALLAGAGLGAERLAATAQHLGRARAALEAAVATVLARSVMLDPAGFAWLDPDGLRSVPCAVGLRALAALIATVGGAEHPPRFAALERLFRRLSDGLGGGRTLGGCRLLPVRDRILVCRERAGVAAAVPVPPGATVRWDGRFEIALPAEAPAGLWLGALGAAAVTSGAGRSLPAAVRPTLPAMRDAHGLVAAPHLGYWRKDFAGLTAVPRLRPTRPLAPAGFRVV